MGEQKVPVAPALPLRRDREILDPEMIGTHDRFDEAGEPPPTVKRSIACSRNARS
jgi:hypothetical protein